MVVLILLSVLPIVQIILKSIVEPLPISAITILKSVLWEAELRTRAWGYLLGSRLNVCVGILWHWWWWWVVVRGIWVVGLLV